MDPTILSVQPDNKNSGWKIFFAICIIFGFVSMFFTGYITSQILSYEKKEVRPQDSKITPGVSSSPSDIISSDSPQMIAGKHYFEDTIIAITKDVPHKNIAATVTRLEQVTNYSQNARMSYFDGENWSRVSDKATAHDATIVSNNVVKRWNISIDPSRVLKQTVQGTLMVKNTTIEFTSGVLQNEIGMRSLPGYTKFMSQGSGIVTIDGVKHDAYLLYTRIYSANSADIQFYNEPFGLTTDWVIFWDSKGNFFHIDDTYVEKATPIYQTHQIAVWEDPFGAVSKTFDLSVSRSSEDPPESYNFSLNYPISSSLTLKKLNAVNKAPNKSYSWYMGSIEGTVTTKTGEINSGIGLVEYIHH